MTTARPPCLHPHVDNVDARTAQCRSCPQRFGRCKRHGIYPVDDASGCPACRRENARGEQMRVPLAVLAMAALGGASLVAIEPRRRCKLCGTTTNRCPCPACGACSTSGGSPLDGCTCGAPIRPSVVPSAGDGAPIPPDRGQP